MGFSSPDKLDKTERTTHTRRTKVGTVIPPPPPLSYRLSYDGNFFDRTVAIMPHRPRHGIPMDMIVTD